MKIDWMLTVLAFGAVVVLYSFWRAHSRKDFDFNAFDMIMQNGRVSRTAVFFILAGLVSTWIVVHRELAGTLTEGFFGLWLTAWVGPILAQMYGTKHKDTGTENAS